MASIKLKASTLLEVIVAMIILATVFSLSSALFWNVQYTSLYSKPLHVQLAAQHMMQETLASNRFYSLTQEEDGYVLEQEVLPATAGANLLHIKIIAVDSADNTLCTIQRLVYVP